MCNNDKLPIVKLLQIHFGIKWIQMGLKWIINSPSSDKLYHDAARKTIYTNTWKLTGTYPWLQLLRGTWHTHKLYKHQLLATAALAWFSNGSRSSPRTTARSVWKSGFSFSRSHETDKSKSIINPSRYLVLGDAKWISLQQVYQWLDHSRKVAAQEPIWL